MSQSGAQDTQKPATPLLKMAPDFDQRRALPDDVFVTIRDTILRSGLAVHPRILDLGAGSGCIGRSFLLAGDDYTGADLSFGMLRAFAGCTPCACLVQAVAACLLFRNDTFDVVLLIQVLSGVSGWRQLLAETIRVLHPGGRWERGAVICQGMPPYKLWEQTPKLGRIPPQRTDTGCFLIADIFGARNMIYVKDEDGLYAADPKKDPRAEFIPRISVQELLKLDLNDLIVERAVPEMMLNARHIRDIQFVNGLKPGQLTAALNRASVGTTIYHANARTGATS